MGACTPAVVIGKNFPTHVFIVLISVLHKTSHVLVLVIVYLDI